MRTIVSILLLLACMAPASVWAQQTMVSVVIQGGDTMPTYTLAPVLVEAQMTRQVRRNAERIDRLTRYVQKVYPYALITAKLLDEYDHDLAASNAKATRNFT
jgi:hypothetical protein